MSEKKSKKKRYFLIFGHIKDAMFDMHIATKNNTFINRQELIDLLISIQAVPTAANEIVLTNILELNKKEYKEWTFKNEIANENKD